jgi:flagellum-specific ATP synthase
MSNAYARQLEQLHRAGTFGLEGRVAETVGLSLAVRDFPAPVGSRCRIDCRVGGRAVPAEVVGFRDRDTLLMPLSSTDGVGRGDVVRCLATRQTVGVGPALLGRVIDAEGRPLDSGGPLPTSHRRSIHVDPLHPLKRQRISEPLGTGLRCIDGFLTCGRGQRLGLFAGPGVGKSILLGQICRYTAADIVVVALVGERGREVRDFLERDLGPEGLKRAVVVVSTGDDPPLLRVKGGMVATAVAEYFRDEGADVLLLLDSLTRMAWAQRQIGLAAGEPPATKGYPPSVFSMLPTLLERAGRTDSGSITGFYAVLVEGDDITEPVSDTVRGILDGHVWLSRPLANRGHFPAISVLESVSRTMVDVVDEQHQAAARTLQRLLSVYADVEDLINIGAYAKGTNPEIDLAISMRERINAFLRQGMQEGSPLPQTRAALVELAQAAEKEAAALRTAAAAPRPAAPNAAAAAR